ncbi:lysosomal acid glucosylceramidase-like [Bacillus rossius redtenbacheri]|uniref:lysosomal acid glucosylceramidase-like n=1 Tax=Bacillus rossius redtenbacheri TaxID=93214 RepID=UPI002FDD508E
MLIHLAFFGYLCCTASLAASPCVARDYQHGSVVCVCNSTYCDTVQPITAQQLAGRTLRHYVSSKAGKRFSAMDMSFSDSVENPAAGAESPLSFSVDRNQRHQEVLGFGGAITDSAGFNIKSLTATLQEQLLRAYFAPEGIGYTFLRVPVAGCDFSLRYYEYDDDHPGDGQLRYFNLTVEDYLYKMPVIRRAQELSNSSVKLFSAPWSAPDWMKNINSTTLASRLKKEYYASWANYYVKFLRAYEQHGLDFWGVTPHNEPLANGYYTGNWNTMGWEPADLRDWFAGHLRPALAAAGFGRLKVMVGDDARGTVGLFADLHFGNETVKDMAEGVAYHWYDENSDNLKLLGRVHDLYPDKFLLPTEACYLSGGTDGVRLGFWDRAAKYATSIIENLNNWASGWVEWNLALNTDGGPSWYGNSADSPVIIHKTTDEFYKQPMFYAIGHFSAFVPPGSRRMGLRAASGGSSLEAVAFLRPDNVTVVVFHNAETSPRQVILKDAAKGEVMLKIEAESINTILY